VKGKEQSAGGVVVVACNIGGMYPSLAEEDAHKELLRMRIPARKMNACFGGKVRGVGGIGHVLRKLKTRTIVRHERKEREVLKGGKETCNGRKKKAPSVSRKKFWKGDVAYFLE